MVLGDWLAPPPSPRRALTVGYDTTRRVGTSIWPPVGTSTWPPVGTFSWPRTSDSGSWSGATSGGDTATSSGGLTEPSVSVIVTPSRRPAGQRVEPLTPLFGQSPAARHDLGHFGRRGDRRALTPAMSAHFVPAIEHCARTGSARRAPRHLPVRHGADLQGSERPVARVAPVPRPTRTSSATRGAPAPGAIRAIKPEPYGGPLAGPRRRRGQLARGPPTPRLAPGVERPARHLLPAGLHHSAPHPLERRVQLRPRDLGNARVFAWRAAPVLFAHQPRGQSAQASAVLTIGTTSAIELTTIVGR